MNRCILLPALVAGALQGCAMQTSTPAPISTASPTPAERLARYTTVKLDPDEWMVIKTHTIEGQRMLDRVGGFMRDVGLIVRSHHERWDGLGYPDGLSGHAIPLEARIIACCDTWNAMRTNRSYRDALDHDQALKELIAATGTQLDPEISATLVAVVEPSAQAEAPLPPSARIKNRPSWAYTSKHPSRALSLLIFLVAQGFVADYLAGG